MKLKFKQIGIYASKTDKEIFEIAQQCCEVLINMGTSVSITKNLDEQVSSHKVGVLSAKNAINLDLLIVIGGDGSLLSATRQFGLKGPPILGVNLGKLGFLADIPPSNLSKSLQEIVSGNFIKDERFFLTSKINKKGTNLLCLNEFVIHSGAVAKMIEYEVHIDGHFVFSQRADGMIISSPTGSTAYALSGGGPIIHPKVKAITLLPMFPHSMTHRPLLVDEGSEITIKLLSSKINAKLSIDSHDSLTLKKGDEVKIKRTNETFSLIHPVGYDFFASCRKKLGWSSNITSTDP